MKKNKRGITAKFVLAVLVTIGVVDAAILVTTVHRRVTAAGGYDEIIAFAQTSPQAKAVLGEGIKPQFPALGYTTGQPRAQFSVFSVKVSGSRGSGRLYAAGNSLDGKWEFGSVTLHSGATHTTDLLPPPTLAALPPVPKRKVFLLPASLDPRDSVEWAPAYYRAKFGIEVEVLSPIAMPAEMVNPGRQQVDSERFIQYARDRYEEIVSDPSNILIGVTSRDIFIRSYTWRYAINWRQDGRFAITSSARVRPRPFLDRWNPEWAASRFRKMLTKNIALLYFDLPMSDDQTSMLYGGVLAGDEIDAMGGSIVGADGEWEGFEGGGAADVTLYDLPGRLPVWRISASDETLPQTSAHVFVSNLSAGLFILRKTDFFFGGQFPLQFVRAYRTQDERSRPFGVGANDSLDIFLTGEMGKYVDLQLETAKSVHFRHLPPGSGQKVDTYIGGALAGSPFSEAHAYFDGKMWTVERPDGWKFYFPYRREAPGANVTVLTGFRDPGGHTYEMTRDVNGDLLSVTTPSGQWLHFKRTRQRTVEEISSSDGRQVRYEYDAGGRLTRCIDSEGHDERYTYDTRSQMLTVAAGPMTPILTNTYDIAGHIASQTMRDGGEFLYHYTRNSETPGSALVPDVITAPNGLLTYFEYEGDGYTQSLPTVPHNQ